MNRFRYLLMLMLVLALGCTQKPPTQDPVPLTAEERAAALAKAQAKAEAEAAAAKAAADKAAAEKAAAEKAAADKKAAEAKAAAEAAKVAQQNVDPNCIALPSAPSNPSSELSPLDMQPGAGAASMARYVYSVATCARPAAFDSAASVDCRRGPCPRLSAAGRGPACRA